ncbi:MAG: hypothetical protein IPP07_28970 [Holophagales bacterium]|nr:hypothetical protein [Holophagales bacterium]
MIYTTIDTSDFDRVDRLMQAAPKTFIEQMRFANVESSKALIQRIKEEKLRGQVLNRISGTLLRSWAAKVPPLALSDGWLGGGGTNLNYAIAHELGVDKTKTVQVKEYVRKDNRLNRYRKSAWHHRRGVNAGVVLDTQGVVVVHSFSRRQHTKLKERRYARSSLEEIRDKVKAIHRDRITKAEEKLKATV